jgi:hypothetical protein
MEADPLCISVTKASWRAGKMANESVVNDLGDWKTSVTPSHVAVLQLLDNIAYNVISDHP